MPLCAWVLVLGGCWKASEPERQTPQSPVVVEASGEPLDGVRHGGEWALDEVYAQQLYTLSVVVAIAWVHADEPTRQRLGEWSLGLPDNTVVDVAYPVRRSVKELAAEAPADLVARVARFFADHANWYTVYAREVTRAMNGPPRFDAHRAWRLPGAEDPNAVAAELSGLLEAAWKLASHRWARQDRASWMSAQLEASEVQRLQDETLTSIGYDGEPFDFGVHVFPSLGVANGMGVVVEADRRLLLVGPTTSTSNLEVLVVHEFMHHPVDRVVRSEPHVARTIDTAECAFAAVETNAGYATWRDFFMETFIRAVAPLVVGVDNPFFAYAYFDEIQETVRRVKSDGVYDLAELLTASAIAVRGTCRNSPTELNAADVGAGVR